MKKIILILAITLSACATTPEEKQRFADVFNQSFKEGMQQQKRYEQIRQEEEYRRSLQPIQSTQCTSYVMGDTIHTNCN